MKIGIIKSTATISPTGGVRIQALMWKEGREKLGHICNLINMWEENDWKSSDTIIVMEYGGNFRNWMKGLSKHNENILSKIPAKNIKYTINNNPIIHFKILPPRYSEISSKSNVGNLRRK